MKISVQFVSIAVALAFAGIGGSMGSLLPAEWQRLCLGVGIGAGVRVWYHCRSVRWLAPFVPFARDTGAVVLQQNTS